MSLLDPLTGTLVVSCQAEPGLPLDRPDHIAALAASAVLGGASAVRVQGAADIRAARAAVAVPIIGLIKARQPGVGVYITPTLADVDEVVEAGADVVAFDATHRPRPFPVRDLANRVRASGRVSMADVSTVQEGRAAMEAGCNLVATTMAGYAGEPRGEGPDFALMEGLAAARVPFVAEGRIRTPEEAARCLALGALFVVVGGAITRPDAITRRFVEHIAAVPARPAARGAFQ